MDLSHSLFNNKKSTDKSIENVRKIWTYSQYIMWMTDSELEETLDVVAVPEIDPDHLKTIHQSVRKELQRRKIP